MLEIKIAMVSRAENLLGLKIYPLTEVGNGNMEALQQWKTISRDWVFLFFSLFLLCCWMWCKSVHSLHKPIWTSLFQWLYILGNYTGNELLVRVFHSFRTFSNPACLLENRVTVGNSISGYVRGVCNITPWPKSIRANFFKYTSRDLQG